jgi:phosphonate transport system permease protein
VSASFESRSAPRFYPTIVLLGSTREFNVRASTVLGVVGAGGIGQELKNSVDLLDFSRLFTIIAVILVAVTAIDSLSGWLRKRFV